MNHNKYYSIRTVLTALFIAQILIVVGVTGWFSFLNGHKAVTEATEQLKNELSLHIKDNITGFVDKPHIINAINAEAYNDGLIDTGNFQKLEKRFWKQIHLFDTVSYISFGDRHGNFIGVEKKNDGSYYIEVRDKTTAGNKYTYLAGSNGERLKLISRGESYDSTLRPWYKAAVKAGGPVWSEIYPFFTEPLRTGVTAVYPVYDISGRIAGVFGTDLVISHIHIFLQNLKAGKTGSTFLIERNGLLVSSSAPEEPFTVTGKEVKRIKASESKVDIISKAAGFLEANFGSYEKIDKHTGFTFTAEERNYYLQVTPISDKYNLDWLIVTVIPEADFMENIEYNKSLTFIICLLGIIVSVIAVIIITSKITKPLRFLSSDMEKIAGFQLEPGKYRKTYFKEINTIQDSMQQMYKKLLLSNARLDSINLMVEKAIITKDTSRLMQLTLTFAIDLMEAEKGFVVEYNSDLRAFRVISALNTLAVTKDSYYVIDDEPYLKEISEKRKTLRIKQEGIILDEKFYTMLLTPFLIDKELKGFICLIDKKTASVEKSFADNDILTLKTLSKFISSVWKGILLFELATIDNLSKLYVRRYVEQALKEEMKKALRYKNAISLIMLDIDNFKRCNDTYGHLVGDKVIREVSDKIRECIRETDIAARYGGEEFLIMLPHTPLDGAYTLAERIRSAIEEMEIFAYTRKYIKVTVSLGISCFPIHGSNTEELIEKADEALYQSKSNGKNLVTVAD